jgi:membrane associated rhomboid family serine protease
MSSNRSYSSVWMLLILFVVIGGVSATSSMKPIAFDAFSLTRQGVMHGELWRLVTYPFLSSSFLNWFFGLLVFYYIAAPLEAVWGTRRFLSLFAVSVIGGGLTAVALNVPLYQGWAPLMTLMLIHGFMFPDSIIYAFLFLPMRIKTLAIISSAFFLALCIQRGIEGLALFSGLLCGVVYYILVTGRIPWVRRAKRSIKVAATDPVGILSGVGFDGLLKRVRGIMQTHDRGKDLTPDEKAVIDELMRKADHDLQLCSQYSFSPDNTICPPCRALGRCLKRYVETIEEN